MLAGHVDLRGTPVASRMLQIGKSAREDGCVWVSDAAAVDSLLIATCALIVR